MPLVVLLLDREWTVAAVDGFLGSALAGAQQAESCSTDIFHPAIDTIRSSTQSMPPAWAEFAGAILESGTHVAQHIVDTTGVIIHCQRGPNIGSVSIKLSSFRRRPGSMERLHHPRAWPRASVGLTVAVSLIGRRTLIRRLYL